MVWLIWEIFLSLVCLSLTMFLSVIFVLYPICSPQLFLDFYRFIWIYLRFRRPDGGTSESAYFGGGKGMVVTLDPQLHPRFCHVHCNVLHSRRCYLHLLSCFHRRIWHLHHCIFLHLPYDRPLPDSCHVLLYGSLPDRPPVSPMMVMTFVLPKTTTFVSLLSEYPVIVSCPSVLDEPEVLCSCISLEGGVRLSAGPDALPLWVVFDAYLLYVMFIG